MPWWPDRLQLDLGQRWGTKSDLEVKEEGRLVCPSCSQPIDKKTESCPNCGMEFGHSSGKAKNEILSTIISALYPGLGQLYNGQLTKALFFGIFGLIVLVYVYYYVGGYLLFYPMILFAFFWIFNVYDAFSTSKRINSKILG